MYFLSDVAEFAKIKVARKLHNRIVNGKVFAVKGSSFWRQGGSKLFEKIGDKRRVFGTAENAKIRKQLLSKTGRKIDGRNVEKNFIDAGLSKLEAKSLHSYIDNGYRYINGYNFDSGTDKIDGMLGVYTNRGLRKLPRANPDNLPSWFSDTEKKKKLIRSINIPDNDVEDWLDKFMTTAESLARKEELKGYGLDYYPYRNQNDRMKTLDDVMITKSPFSTSLDLPKRYGMALDHFAKFDPSTETQVKFKIKRKKNTEGRWIGNLSGQDEGEVLFPSGSKFRVKKITTNESITNKNRYDTDWTNKDGYTIELEEL